MEGIAAAIRAGRLWLRSWKWPRTTVCGALGMNLPAVVRLMPSPPKRGRVWCGDGPITYSWRDRRGSISRGQGRGGCLPQPVGRHQQGAPGRGQAPPPLR